MLEALFKKYNAEIANIITEDEINDINKIVKSKPKKTRVKKP
jgi:hypothetical protein